MSERSVASRYAKSILDLAIEKNLLEVVFQNMLDFKGIGNSNKQLITVLRSPIIPPEKKLSIIKALFENKFHSLTLSFFEIMIKKERAEIIFPAASEFIRQYNLKKQIIVAEITTAVPLTAALEKEILSKVSELYKGEIIVKKVVDEGIIGGFILKIEDRQIDSSYRKKLSDLKMELINSNYIKQV